MRSAANASLTALRQAEDGWQFCLQGFCAAHEEPVKFWCLQTVVDSVSKQRRYASLPDMQKQSVRAVLMQWLQSKGGPQTDEPVSVKNKFAQLLVAILRVDYPQCWPLVFDQMLATLQNGPVSIDMFLRVLKALNEDVVVHEESNGYDSEVAMRVKDGMRDGCLPQLADAWLSILQLHETTPALAAACLHTVHLYVPWIPIGLVANPSWLGMLQPFLRIPELHEGACLVLTEIITKRMDASPKMEHLAQLGVVRLLGEPVANGLHVTPRFAGLISALAHEILDCWDRLFTATPPTAHTAMLVPRAVEMLSLTMPTLLACLASEDMETSQETLGFLHSYIGRLRKLLPSKEDLSQHEGHLQHLLIVMGRKSLYPEDFAFDEADEGEEAFLAYRREISTLFKGVARVHASLAQEMVRSTLSSTLEAIHSVPWTHLEVALWLLHTLGEGLPEALLREKGGFFQQMMVTLISSSTSAYPHRAVQLLFFEIVVRYYRFFLVNPEHLTSAISGFLGPRGVYNVDSVVRQRACYLLLRFVKQTLKSVTTQFADVARSLLDILCHQYPADSDFQRLLAQLYAAEGLAPPPAPAGLANGVPRDSSSPLPEPPQLSTAERLNLCEACGLLLGAGLSPAELVGEQTQRLLEMPITQLQALSSQAAAGTPASLSLDSTSARQLTQARYAEAAFHVSSIAVASKGFANLTEEPQKASLRESFSHATQVALSSMSVFGQSPEVRGKCLMLLHRMVETLGEELLDYLDAAMQPLLAMADAKELGELVTLINQLVLKFRSKIIAPVTSLFSPLSSASFAHLDALDRAIAASSSAAVGSAAPASDDVRDRRSLLRCFYALIHSLVHSDLVDVLAAPQNSAHMRPSLRVLLAGCVEGPDLKLQGQCFSILQRLVELWVGSLQGFEAYVLQEVLPVCFQAPAQPHFSLKDASALPLLEASASLQKAILAKLGGELVSYLRDHLLPSLGCDASFSAEYARQLAESDTRQLRDFMRAQLVSARQ